MKNSLLRISIVLIFCFGFFVNNTVSASANFSIKSSVVWNNHEYKVCTPTNGVNDSVKKEFNSIQKKIGRCLNSKQFLYSIKGYSTSKNIAYKVGKYYYMCKVVKLVPTHNTTKHNS